MIEKSTYKYIKELQSKDENIFYSGEGDPYFFREGIRHIGATIFLELTKKISNTEDLYTVVCDDLYVYSRVGEIVTHYRKGDIIEFTPLKQE